MASGLSISLVVLMLTVVHGSSVEDDFSKLVNKVNHMEDNIHNMMSIITELEKQNSHLMNENKQLKLQVNNISNEVDVVKQRGRRSFPDIPYAFTAVLDHTIDQSGLDQTVIFNQILLNDGNAYNKHTGIFTVPVEGVYMFYLVFAGGYEPHRLWMHIVVDGAGKVSGLADNLQAGHDAQGTNLMLLHLHKGDSVWVTTFHNVGKIYGYNQFTTFSGMLLYQY